MSTHRSFFIPVLALALAALAVPTGAAVGTPAGTDELDSRLVGLMDEGYNDEAVLVSGGVASMGGLDGLALYDVTDPARPQWLGGTNGWIRGLAQEGHVLYVKAGSGDTGQVVVLDVADPTNPSVLAHINPPMVPGMPPDAYPQLDFEGPLLVKDGYLYAPSLHYQNPWTSYRALNVYDVHDPASPVLTGQTPLHRDTSANDLLLRSDYLYVADTLDLEAVNVADPAAPSLVSPSLGRSSNALAADGALLYSCRGASSGELDVYSLGDPAHPHYEGPIQAPADVLSCVDVELTHPGAGQSVLVAAWSADSFQWVEVYDVTPPVKLGDASLLMDLGEIDVPNESVNDIELDGNYVYIAQWDSGVRVAEVDYTAVTPQAPDLSKYPSADRVVLHRKAGVAFWSFFVTVASPLGEAVSDKTVRIQRSLNGTTWKTLGSYSTDDKGIAGVKIKFTGPGTSYWRWSSPAEGSWLAAKTPRTKVVVR